MLIQALLSLLLALAPRQQVPAPPQESFRVSGTVVDALGGQPLARAQVSISLPDPADAAQVMSTGDDGRFLFEHVPAGRYVLLARRRGYVEQRYKQHGSFSTAIVTGPSLDTENLRFEMRPNASISGQVSDEMNEPVRLAQVMLLREGVRSGRRQAMRWREVVTDDQGHYHFGHLPTGTYFIGVIAQPWYAQPVQMLRVQNGGSKAGSAADRAATGGNAAVDVAYPVTFFSNATDITAASPITLNPGDTETADITLQPVPAVYLTIHYASADPSEGFGFRQATLHIADGVEVRLVAGVNTMQNEPGVAVVAGLPPGRVSLEWTSSKGSESTAHSQTVQLGGDVEIADSDRTTSPVVSGIVRRDDGLPLTQQIRLFLRDVGMGSSNSAVTRPGGEFTFEGQGLSAGSYEVTAWSTGGAMVRSITATGGKASGRTVEIGYGEDVRLTVVLSKGIGTIAGFALKNGKPVDGVLVVLVPKGFGHDLDLFRIDQSDSDGSFNLARILPGKYTVVAIENRWDLEWSNSAAMQKYLAGGKEVQVEAGAKLAVKVNVQE